MVLLKRQMRKVHLLGNLRMSKLELQCLPRPPNVWVKIGIPLKVPVLEFMKSHVSFNDEDA